jgi:hypothetical protein
MFKVSVLIALLLLCLLGVVASRAQGIAPSQPTQHEPRTLGNKAVMEIFYYAPATLEITYVDVYLFPTLDKCNDAISKAFAIATPLASEGDLLNVRCSAVNPPPKPAAPPPKGSTEL